MSKLLVYHGEYGCDTGCCGHWIARVSDDAKAGNWGLDQGSIESERFVFYHPYGEDFKSWARERVAEEFGEEHVADLDWENCVVIDD